MCTLRLASNRAPKDGKDQGAVFIDVVSFGRLAEAVAENLGKGRQVAVTGRIEFRQWKAEDGSPRSKHHIIANQVEFLAKPAGNGSAPEPAPRRRCGRAGRPPAERWSTPAPSTARPSPTATSPAEQRRLLPRRLRPVHRAGQPGGLIGS